MKSKHALSFIIGVVLIVAMLTSCNSPEVAQPPENPASIEAAVEETYHATVPVTEVSPQNRKLNVSILQMPILNSYDSLEYMRDAVDGLMSGIVRPELVVGVEYGLGFIPQSLDSDFIRYLGAIAKKHGIYFIPGTFSEIGEDGESYNTCPIFGPDGSLIYVYRKKAPYYPVEDGTMPGPVDDYCIFTIPEKNITIGVQICYDQFFPEIARTLALKGAEMIICPSYDPAEFDHIPDILPRARALENELFYIWTNGVGGPCGNSIIVDPEGKIIYKCDKEETTYTATLDFDKVTEKRLYGVDQHLNSLRYLQLESPYADNLDDSPLFRDWPNLTMTRDEFDDRVQEIGMNSMPRITDKDMQATQDATMDEIMQNLRK